MGAYMVVKGRIFMRALKLWRTAFYKLLQSTRYGKTPNPDQMKASGGFCPICQDAYQEPTMLHCKHIFCEESPLGLIGTPLALCAGPKCQKTPAGEMEQLVSSYSSSNS